MAAILATVDIEDLATPKVRAVKDALADLTSVQEQYARATAGNAAYIQAGADALNSYASESRRAAAGLRETQAQVNALTPQVGNLTSATVEYLSRLAQQQAAQRAAYEEIKLIASGLAGLSQDLRAGTTLTRLQADALNELANASRTGSGFTQAQAQALQQLNQSVQQGIPLSAQQLQQLQSLTQAYSAANSATLGTATATQQLIVQQQASAAAIATNAKALQLLSTQLQNGGRLTQLQAQALHQLTQSAQQGNGFTQQHAQTLQQLNQVVQQGLPLTAQQAQNLQQVSQQYTAANIASNAMTTGTQGLTVQMIALATALTIVAAGVGAYIERSAELAARVETLGVVQQMTAKNSHLSTLELQTQVESIRRLGITTQESTDAVLQFVQANLKASDAAKLARAAQDLAVVAGENSSQTFQRLTTAIQVQQPLLLRQVGITTTLDQIYREYALSIHKTVQQLSMHEKQQAFLNKIMEQAAQVSGAYEAAMTTAGKMSGSMARLTEELSLKIGNSLLPAYTLWISTQFHLLEVMNKLSPEIYTAIASMGLFLAGVTAVAAGINSGLLPAIGRLIATSAAFFATPWGLVMLGIAAAIGAATFAFVKYTQAQKDTTEQLSKDIAARQAQANQINDQVAAIEKLYLANDQTTGGVLALEQAYLALKKTAPDAVALVNGQYAIQFDWIEKNIDAQRRLNREAAEGIETQLQNAEKQHTALVRQLEDIEKRRREAQSRLQEMTQPTVAAQPGLLERLSQSVAAANSPEGLDMIEQYRDAVERLKAQEDELRESVGNAATKVGTLTTRANEAREAWDRNFAAQQNAIRAQGNLNDLYEKFGRSNVDAEIRKLGISMAFTTQMTAANKDEWSKFLDEIKRFIDTVPDIRSALEQQQREAEQRRKAIEQAYKSALDMIRGTAARTEGQLEGVNQGFKEVARGAELYHQTLGNGLGGIDAYNKLTSKQRDLVDEYVARLQRGASAINTFNGLSDQQKAKLTALAVAANDLLKIQLDKQFREWAKGAEEAAKKFEEFTAQSVETLRRQGQVDARHLDAQILKDRQDTLERVRQMEEDNVERVLVSRMRAVDQAIYAERKRVDDIRRQILRERDARTAAFAEEEAQLRDRFALLRLEAERRRADVAEQLQQQALLRASQLETRRVSDPKYSQTDYERDLQRSREVLQLGLQSLDAYAQNYQQRLTQEENFQRAILSARREAAAANDALVDEALDHTVATSRIVIERIRDQYNTWKNFAGSVVEAVATQFASGMTRMLTGAQSWGDGIKAVWTSVKQSFFSMVDDMIQKWIRQGVLQMLGRGAVGGPTGMRGLMSGLFGTGSMAAVGQFGVRAGIPAGMNIGAVVAPPGVAGAAGTAGAAAPWYAGMGGLALASAGGGFLAGNLLGRLFNSRTTGALAGAGAGAGTGALIGTVVFPGVGTAIGAGIGAIAGALGGLLGGGREAREVKKFRDELIAAHGGIESFRKEARAAGFDLSKMLDTRKMDEFKMEALKLDAVLKFGSMDDLRKKAQLVGVDIDRIFAIKKAEDFNKEMERLNGLLAEQQQRLEGWKQVGEGLTGRSTAWVATLTRDFNDLLRTMSTRTRTDLQNAFRAAVRRGFGGDEVEFILSRLRQAAAGGNNPFGFTTAQLAIYRETVQRAQADFDRMGKVAALTFANILRETGDINAAMEAITPTLDVLAAAQRRFGLESTKTLDNLLEFRQVIRQNQDITQSFSAITQELSGLIKAGGLTQGLFRLMGEDVSSLFERLRDRGVEESQAYLIAQPALQQLYEAQKKYGFTLDANTQKLLDMALAQGLVGDKFRETNEKILSVLVAIADVLGAKIPTALRDFESQASRTAQQVKQDFEGAAWGNSPGGIREVVTQTNAAIDAVRRYREQVARDSTVVDAHVLDMARNYRAVRPVVTGVLAGEVPTEPAAPAAPAVPAGNIVLPPRNSDSGGVTLQVVYQQGDTYVEPRLLDTTDFMRVWETKFRPQMLADADHNAAQFTTQLEAYLVRYRKRTQG